MNDIQAAKAALRKEMQKELNIMDSTWFHEKNVSLALNLYNLIRSLNVNETKAVLCFVPFFKGEPDVISIPPSDKFTLFCPKTSDYDEMSFFKMPSELIPGRFGIPEPKLETSDVINYNEYQLIIAVIPGVAFDLKGVRLGRGKGIYDRYLQNFSKKKTLVSIGVGWSFQVRAQIPADQHDQKMNYIVTEEKHYGPF